MAIVVACTRCGRQLKVRDELVGKRLKCPGCGATFDAKAGAAVTPVRAGASKSAAPKVAISWGLIVGIGAVIAIVVGILMFVFGPVAVWHEWEKYGSKPNDDVEEVVTKGLQSYLSQHHLWNPRKPGATPGASHDTIFIRPFAAMSMPDSVPCKGSTTNGAFTGRYHPKTGEVEADVAVDGGGLPGLGGVRPGTQTIHVTGRMKGNTVVAEIDGKTAELFYPPEDDDK